MKYAVNIKYGYRLAAQSIKANCGGLSVFKKVVCSKEAFVSKIPDELNTQNIIVACSHRDLVFKILFL